MCTTYLFAALPPGLAPAKPSLRLGRVWVGVRCGGGKDDALKRQNPWPLLVRGSFKGGGYLLSHLVGQYHRHKRV